MVLADVERASNKEFKASVLAAYERGERWISVPRLGRLAYFYKVSLSELWPGTVTVQCPGEVDQVARPGDLIVDMAVLDRTYGAEAVRLRQFCRLIAKQRGGQPSSGVLRLRRSDQAAVAALLAVTTEEASQVLDNLSRPVADHELDEEGRREQEELGGVQPQLAAHQDRPRGQ
jgi:hypothetical protein